MTSADLITVFKKQPIGFVCAGLCVVLAAVIYFRSDLIDETRTAYEDKSAEASKITANVRNSENLTKQVAEIQALSAGLDARLIHAGRLAENLQYFYKLEAENGVKLIDVRQGNLPKAVKGSQAAFVGIPYNVSVQGPFKQVMAFLQKLENGPHFCRFYSVSFSKAGSLVDPADPSAPISVTMTLELLGVP